MSTILERLSSFVRSIIEASFLRSHCCQSNNIFKTSKSHDIEMSNSILLPALQLHDHRVLLIFVVSSWENKKTKSMLGKHIPRQQQGSTVVSCPKNSTTESKQT